MNRARGVEDLISRHYPGLAEPDVAELAALSARRTELADYPLAAAVEKNVLIYNCAGLLAGLEAPGGRQALMAELVEALANGPGVVVLRGAARDPGVVDRASELFREMISEQQRAGRGGGDHFAKPGANDRVWNSLEKHCLADPENFARYYGNPFLDLISEAWLGPSYQMTAQLNVVNPGGDAQSPHRDYHLGFASSAMIRRYPLHVHLMSPVLTLQGAIAHVDAPVETGPTLLLPFSQLWPEGYIAMGREDVKAHFAAHHVHLPLEKGDMLFFSPALLHAAGANRSASVRRMVNLFQVSSAFGRAMETVDRLSMVKALYPALRRGRAEGWLSPAEVEAALASAAEGYSFPTNLDSDPPIGGMAPQSQADLVRKALAGDLSQEALAAALEAQADRRQS